MKVKVEDATVFFIYLYDKIQEAKRKREKCNVSTIVSYYMHASLHITDDGPTYRLLG